VPSLAGLSRIPFPGTAVPGYLDNVAARLVELKESRAVRHEFSEITLPPGEQGTLLVPLWTISMKTQAMLIFTAR
jgi:hypothetical protein